MAPQYFVEGRFPGARRKLGIGSRGVVKTILATQEKPEGWIGILPVKGRVVRGKIIFERGADDKPFRSEKALIDFLREQYNISYLRDISKPAVETGG